MGLPAVLQAGAEHLQVGNQRVHFGLAGYAGAGAGDVFVGVGHAQRAHLYNPRNVVPESKMPAYPWLVENKLDGKHTETKLKALRMLGVPYTDEDIAGARASVAGKTEMDALVAYLQVLGTSLKNRR